MTTATVAATSSERARDWNIGEIWKFARISLIWLVIIFGAVWMASWVVGGVLPRLIENVCGSDPTAKIVADGIRMLTPLIAMMVFIPINATYMVLAERRGLALLTVRKGPNRVGPDGFLQTAADAVKLLFKENIDPEGSDWIMFTLAPIIFFAPSVFGAIPLLAAVTAEQDLFKIVNLPTGIFYILAMSSVPVVGIVMGGWASNNKYSLVGGLRSAAQAISYEIPLVLAILTICLLVGTLNVADIAWLQNPMELAKVVEGDSSAARWEMLRGGSNVFTDLQKYEIDVSRLADFGFLNWNIFGGDTFTSYLARLFNGAFVSPVECAFKGVLCILLIVCSVLSCGLYLTGACAEINRIPFDLPEAESELVSGYNTEYSGIRFAIFFLAEFTNLFIVSSIAVVMWFGGGSSPFPPAIYEPVLNILATVASSINGILNGIGLPNILNAAVLSGAIWVIIKTYALIFFAILVRGTLPRFRIDQLMDFGWKRLIPLALIILLAVTYLKELI